jgi:tryptophanyl-tRNA synthetase
VAAAVAARNRSADLERAIAADPSRFRVLTGDRPTGPLHLGHPMPALNQLMLPFLSLVAG